MSRRDAQERRGMGKPQACGKVEFSLEQQVEMCSVSSFLEGPNSN